MAESVQNQGGEQNQSFAQAEGLSELSAVEAIAPETPITTPETTTVPVEVAAPETPVPVDPQTAETPYTSRENFLGRAEARGRIDGLASVTDLNAAREARQIEAPGTVVQPERPPAQVVPIRQENVPEPTGIAPTEVTSVAVDTWAEHAPAPKAEAVPAAPAESPKIESLTTAPPAAEAPKYSADQLAKMEKSREQNVDRAIEMAHAENPARTLESNLSAMGEAKMARSMGKTAGQEGKAAESEYNKDFQAVVEGAHAVAQRGGIDILEARELHVRDSYLRAVVGEKPVPVCIRDVGTKQRPILERSYRSALSPNVAVIEHWNPLSGEVLGVYTVGVEGNPFVTKTSGILRRQTYEAPSPAVDAKIARAVEAQAKIPASTQNPYPSATNNVRSATVMGMSDALMASEGFSPEEIQAIRKKQKPLGFWARLFGAKQ